MTFVIQILYYMYLFFFPNFITKSLIINNTDDKIFCIAFNRQAVVNGVTDSVRQR